MSVVCAACCHTALVFVVMHLYNILILFLLSIPLKNTFKKSDIDKSTEESTIPVCPSLMDFFFNRGNTEGTNSSKILCLMFVYVCFVLYKFVSGLVLWSVENLWFDDLCTEKLGVRLKFVFGPDIILYG